MIAIGLILMIVGLAAVCWLLFSLAVYALPLFAGVSACLYAHGTGAGLFGAILVGTLTGAATLVAGQVAFATVRAPLARVAVALMFAGPAAVAGYHAAGGLAALAVPTEPWRQAFAVVGAIIVGPTAWVRLAALSAGPVREQMRPPIWTPKDTQSGHAPRLCENSAIPRSHGITLATRRMGRAM